MTYNRVSLNHFNYEGHLAQRFKQMLLNEEFADVTLVCDDDKQLKAHRVVLSSSSSVLKNIFDKNNHQHPLLYLSGISSQVLKGILEFIYTGEVQVEQEELEKFMKISTKLKVYGLMSDNGFKQELTDDFEATPDEIIENLNEKVKEIYDQSDEKVNCAMCNQQFENADELKTHVLTKK